MDVSGKFGDVKKDFRIVFEYVEKFVKYDFKKEFFEFFGSV